MFIVADKKKENLETDIRAMIAEIVGLSPEKITPSAAFVDDLGMDSMMALEILASLEKKYKICIPEDSLVKISNLRETVKLVAEKIGR